MQSEFTFSKRFILRHGWTSLATLLVLTQTFPTCQRPAAAATVTWNLAGSGAWDTTTGNWTGGSPTPNLYANGDAAIFNNTAGGTITAAGTIAPVSTTVSAASGTYTFTGVGISSGTLVKSGAGTLIINNSNSFSGVTLSGGVLAVGNNSALGGGTINATGAATLTAADATARTLSNNLTLNNHITLGTTGTGNLLVTGTLDTGGGARNFTVQNTLTEFSGTINGTNTRSKLGDGTLVFSGSLSAGNLQVSQGVLVLSAANNHNQSSIPAAAVAGSTLRVTHTAGLGTGQVTLNSGVLQLLNNGFGSGGTIAHGSNTFATSTSATATIHVANNGANTGNTIALGGTYQFGNSTLNVTGANGYALSLATLNLAAGANGTSIINPTTANFIIGAVTNGGSFTHTLQLNGTSHGNQITGTISNAAGTIPLTKAGTGTWTLLGANTYSGATSVTAGALRIQHANALGTTTNGTTVSSNAALEIQGGVTTAAEALTLSGTGVSSAGALRNLSGNNNYTGAITLAAAARINSDAGTLTLSNAAAIGGTGSLALTVGGAGNTIIQSPITGTRTLTKDGAGTLTLTGANSYTGTTFVSNGTLLVNNIHNGGAYTVNGGTLGGTGVIDTNGGNIVLSAGGKLSPGASAGTLTLGLEGGVLNLSAIGTGALIFEIGAIGASDQVVITSGTLNIGSLRFDEFAFSALSGIELGTYKLFDGVALTGSVDSLNDAGTFAGGKWGGYIWNDGQDVMLTLNFSAVPEPGTLLLAALGMVGLAWHARRRSR